LLKVVCIINDNLAETPWGQGSFNIFCWTGVVGPIKEVYRTGNNAQLLLASRSLWPWST